MTMREIFSESPECSQARRSGRERCYRSAPVAITGNRGIVGESDPSRWGPALMPYLISDNLIVFVISSETSERRV